MAVKNMIYMKLYIYVQCMKANVVEKEQITWESITYLLRKILCVSMARSFEVFVASTFLEAKVNFNDLIQS